jgi:hypothetical protein
MIECPHLPQIALDKATGALPAEDTGTWPDSNGAAILGFSDARLPGIARVGQVCSAIDDVSRLDILRASCRCRAKCKITCTLLPHGARCADEKHMRRWAEVAGVWHVAMDRALVR